jgi:endogenous inhibitor of DNA gyrase (YacG/DUF329 family)
MAKKDIFKRAPSPKKDEETVDAMRCDRCRQPLGAGRITVNDGRRFCSPGCQGIDR